MFVSAISLLEPCRVRGQKLSFEFHNEERTTDTKTTNSFHRMFSVNTLVIKQNDGVRKIFTTKRHHRDGVNEVTLRYPTIPPRFQIVTK